MHLHDPKHLTVTYLDLYGKERIRPEPGAKTIFIIEPTEVIHINQENNPCILEKDKMKNIWDCITEQIYQGMNCSLPWSSKKVGPQCSLPEEYNSYYARTVNALMLDADHIEKALHCTPACKRIEYSAKPFAILKDPTMTDKLEVEMYFAKDKFPVNEQYYIYDGTTFIADFGSYLGLLLGYSVLAFFDTLMHLFKTIFEKCNI